MQQLEIIAEAFYCLYTKYFNFKKYGERFNQTARLPLALLQLIEISRVGGQLEALERRLALRGGVGRGEVRTLIVWCVQGV